MNINDKKLQEKMKMENNIFKYATKELSQDATVAWLVDCYHFKETKEIGEKFIKEFILEKDEEIKEVKIIRQHYKIDVFIQIETDKMSYNIIIENKRGTFLHDNQLRNYVNRVKENGKKIIVLLFKNSNIYPFEELQYEMEQQDIKKDIGNIDIEFKLRDAQSFLNALKIDTNHMILNMIIEYYREIIADNEKLKTYDWKLQIKKQDWKEFYNIVINELKKINIQECRDENGNIIGIKRPKGMGIQAVRTDFIIKNVEFIDKANKIIPKSEGIWRMAIDWGVYELTWNKPVRLILFCNTDREERIKFQKFIKSKIKEEINVTGTKNTFATITIKEEEIIGQDKEKIAEIIVEKVYKIYNEIKKLFDEYEKSVFEEQLLEE